MENNAEGRMWTFTDSLNRVVSRTEQENKARVKHYFYEAPRPYGRGFTAPLSALR